MSHDIHAFGFPRELDGHPLLAWMGSDWVDFVIRALRDSLREQDPGTELLGVRSAAAPEIQTRAREAGVTAVEVALRLQLVVRDSSGRHWRLRGWAVFDSAGRVGFQLLSSEPMSELVAVLRETRGLVAASEDRSALGELDEAIARLHDRSLLLGDVEGLFLPTGGLQEVSIDNGWGARYLALADRFDALHQDPFAFFCDRCGAEAGRVELDGADLRRETFTGTLTQPVGPGSERAVAEGSAALFASDPELAPWFCPVCEATYCGEHWQRWDVFDDDGFHDSIRGRCPEGHERMLED